jgi:hypothetical protein
MAREKVVKVKCDRCNRAELVPSSSVADKVGADFEASFIGQRLVYEDLCLRCRDAMKHSWQEMKEWERQVKYTWIENGPKVGENEAAPLQVAPDYSPPKPHSAAAIKR